MDPNHALGSFSMRVCLEDVLCLLLSGHGFFARLRECHLHDRGRSGALGSLLCSAAMTLDIYADLFDGNLDAVAVALDQAVSEPCEPNVGPIA